jgi:Zn-dependent protease
VGRDKRLITLAIPFRFSKTEVKDILVSTLALGFIFSWSLQALSDIPAFITEIIITTAIIGFLAFIPHELMHKFFANKYHCHAQYEMWKTGLLIALALAVFTNGAFVFAAPGAVVIYTMYRSHAGIHNVQLTSKQNAIISAAGPATNMAIAALAFAAALYYPHPLLFTVVKINAFLAMFNLLPIPPLDGSKIIWYNIVAWGSLMALSVLMYIFL